MSFRLKTILGIALIESILLLILIFSSMNFLSESNQAHLDQRAKTTSVLFSRAVKNAILSTDIATLESFTEDILTLPDIVYVRISNNDFILTEGGATEFIGDAPPSESHKSPSNEHVDINIDVNEGGAVFGKIEIGLSTKAMQNTLSEAQHWALAIASLEVILVAIFSFILGTYLTRQLLQLKQGAEMITRSGPGYQIQVSGKDEVAELANSFNSMSSTLAQSYKKLSESIAAERTMSATARQKQAQNNAILSASMDAIITIDQNGNVIDYNQVAEQTFGWTYDEIFGLKLGDFIIPKHKRRAHQKDMQAFLISKTSPVINQRLELTAVHKSGQTLPIEINISPIETEQGTLFTAFIRDISARLEAETELRLAAQTFKSSEAMFISDAQGNIIRINQAFTTITGYDEKDAIGQNPSILASGRHPTEYYKAMWNALTTQGKWSGEIYNKRKNGEIYPEYLNISAVKDNSNNTTHYIAHFMDISEQKSHEESLRQARLEAEASNESKSHFLASMSHEIRTPMNAVLGILDLLKETNLTDKQLPLINTARDSGELLMAIINDILDFTKMDVDEKVLQLGEFDLHLLLDKCITLLKHLADKKSLQLHLQRSSNLPQFVLGDADRIQQILINLINNAIKFTEQGSIDVIASLASNSAERYVLQFQVIDTGIGIAEKYQSRLFDEFTMVDQTHSRKYEGTGLGLAICKRLITLMDGSINVTSQLGKGSTFDFTISLEKAHPENIQKVLQKDCTRQPKANTRILLAEDNIANQMVISKILELSQLKVDIVNNGLEALQAVQNKTYDIVLMDISMPEMDGMTATKAIRALTSPLGDIPIVALTAHTLSGDKERFIAAGMNDYLSKPINRVATLTCIAHWTAPQVIEPNIKVPKAIATEQALKTSIALPENGSSAPYVDEQVLQQLVIDTDAEIVPELISLYIEDSQQRMRLIETAIAKQDIKTLDFETHTIGSSAIAHGNAKLHKLARQIEMLCKQDQHQQALQEAMQLIDVAQQSFEQLAIRAKKGFTNS